MIQVREIIEDVLSGDDSDESAVVVDDGDEVLVHRRLKDIGQVAGGGHRLIIVVAGDLDHLIVFCCEEIQIMMIFDIP